MFEGATAFNRPLNNWNVSNVTNMSHMFAFAENFNQPLTSWNVTPLTYVYAMFRGDGVVFEDIDRNAPWYATHPRNKP